LLLKGLEEDTMKTAVRKYMTLSPVTIGEEQTLERAHEVMREAKVRHLPVLQGGKLVGLVSQRDLHLIETLRDVDPSETTVAEAMSQDVYAVSASTSLLEVALEMVEHKYGSAVIVEGPRVIGVFTTTDALRALIASEKREAGARVASP
jgi:acetoin utilization protein AcuB